MTSYALAQPAALWALLLIPALALARRWWGVSAIRFVPYAAAWAGGPRPASGRLAMLAVYASLALLILAIARPQQIERRQETVSRGYDLMLALDLSTSMLAEDYRGPKGPLNRLETLRPIVRQFITRRPNDRIGVVVFAGRAYTLAPLTTDHAWLDEQVAAMRIGVIEDGTALGDGLGIALAALQDGRTQASSAGAFVILLSDGANTSGVLTPPQAAAVARHRRIPVYTIGAGREGMAPVPIFDGAGRRAGTRMQPSSLDVAALKAIADQTGGRYLAAGDAAALAAAFAAIDAARKAEFSVRTDVTVIELFPWPAGAALMLLLAAGAGLSGERRPQARAAAT